MRNPIPIRRSLPPGPWIAAVAAVALFALAAPLAAEVFHVELTDGQVFDTLYKPEEASWDSELVLLLTDVGSWIAVPKADISAITNETENQGFGKVIDTTTILLGWAANDAPIPGEETEFSTIDRLQQFYQSQQQQDYSVQQFVEPNQAGGNTGGLPAYGATAPPNVTYFGNLGGTTVTQGPAPGTVSAPAPTVGGGPQPIE